MLVFGCLSTPRPPKLSMNDLGSIQRLSITTAQSFLSVLTTKCVLSNIQALLLLCLYFHNNNDRNAAWNLVGTATRMSIALGLHQSVLDTQFRPVERETRKRVWCTLFTFDQFLCSSLGRPSGSADSDVEVRVPIECLLDGGNGAGEQSAEQSLELQYLLSAARRLVDQRHSHAASIKRASKVMHTTSTHASKVTTQNILDDLHTGVIVFHFIYNYHTSLLYSIKHRTLSRTAYPWSISNSHCHASIRVSYVL